MNMKYIYWPGKDCEVKTEGGEVAFVKSMVDQSKLLGKSEFKKISHIALACMYAYKLNPQRRNKQKNAVVVLNRIRQSLVNAIMLFYFNTFFLQ